MDPSYTFLQMNIIVTLISIYLQFIFPTVANGNNTNLNSPETLGAKNSRVIEKYDELHINEKNIKSTESGVYLPNTPGELLKPDKFLFLTFDKYGNVVMNKMSLNNIKSILAAADKEKIDEISVFDSSDEDTGDNAKITDIILNVQNLLRSEAIKHVPALKKAPSIPNSQNLQWSSILPSILFNNKNSTIINSTISNKHFDKLHVKDEVLNQLSKHNITQLVKIPIVELEHALYFNNSNVSNFSTFDFPPLSFSDNSNFHTENIISTNSNNNISNIQLDSNSFYNDNQQYTHHVNKNKLEPIILSAGIFGNKTKIYDTFIQTINSTDISTNLLQNKIINKFNNIHHNNPAISIVHSLDCVNCQITKQNIEKEMKNNSKNSFEEMNSDFLRYNVSLEHTHLPGKNHTTTNANIISLILNSALNHSTLDGIQPTLCHKNKISCEEINNENITNSVSILYNDRGDMKESNSQTSEVSPIEHSTNVTLNKHDINNNTISGTNNKIVESIINKNQIQTSNFEKSHNSSQYTGIINNPFLNLNHSPSYYNTIQRKPEKDYNSHPTIASIVRISILEPLNHNINSSPSENTHKIEMESQMVKIKLTNGNLSAVNKNNTLKIQLNQNLKSNSQSYNNSIIYNSNIDLQKTSDENNAERTIFFNDKNLPSDNKRENVSDINNSIIFAMNHSANMLVQHIKNKNNDKLIEDVFPMNNTNHVNNKQFLHSQSYNNTNHKIEILDDIMFGKNFSLHINNSINNTEDNLTKTSHFNTNNSVSFADNYMENTHYAESIQKNELNSSLSKKNQLYFMSDFSNNLSNAMDDLINKTKLHDSYNSKKNSDIIESKIIENNSTAQNLLKCVFQHMGNNTNNVNKRNCSISDDKTPERISLNPEMKNIRPILNQNDMNIMSHELLSLRPLKNTPNLSHFGDNLEPNVELFINSCNELAFNFWNTINKNLKSSRSLTLSSFGIISTLSMIFLGTRGTTSDEMNDILKLDDVKTFNPHLIFRNISNTIVYHKHNGIANAAFVRELFAERSKLRKTIPFYLTQAQQYYNGNIVEVDIDNANEILRKRTNLLIRKQTNNHIKDYIKNLNSLRGPLIALSANVFQTDCKSQNASSEGRDGELYFTVSPVIRQRKLIPIPASIWKTGVLAGYEPGLDATAIALGGPEKLISIIYVLPGQQSVTAPDDNLDLLESRLVKGVKYNSAWNKLLRVIIPRPGLELQVPKFTHSSIINLTSTLEILGLKNLIKSGANLRGINGGSEDVFVSDLLQVNLFSTCGEDNTLNIKRHTEVYPSNSQQNSRGVDLKRKMKTGKDRQSNQEYLSKEDHQLLHDSEKPKLKLNRPFLYFVRYNPNGLILHMGRFNPRLLP